MMMSGSGAAAPPPNPSAIFGTDLLAWYKRGALIYDSLVGGSLCTTDLQEIGRWEDQTANAYHIIRNFAIGSGHCYYRTTLTNHGIATVQPASGDILKLPDALGSALSSAGKGAWFVCLKTPTTHAGVGCWKVGTSGSDALYDWSDGHIYDDWGSNTRYDTGAAPVDISAAYQRYVVTTETGGTKWRNFFNNTLNFTSSSNTAAFKTTGLTFYPQANVYELVVVKVIPNSTQLAQMETYLST